MASSTSRTLSRKVHVSGFKMLAIVSYSIIKFFYGFYPLEIWQKV